MTIAQSLYENSHITYMRTDSATLGQSAQTVAISTIENQFSKQYVHPQYSTDISRQEGPKKKQLNAQEAHEAIRPTTKLISFPDGTQRELFVEPNATGLVGLEKKLYDLIYKRTLASVMAPALFETSTINIHGKSGNMEGNFKANERKMIFPGYQMISKMESPSPLNQTTCDVEQELFPKVGTQLILSSTNPNQFESDLMSIPDEGEVQDEVFEDTTNPSPTFSPGIVITSHKTAPPLRFTEASFIRELETAGVGRPSTYASIIQTLEDRGYILVDKRTIIPTVKGIVVSNLLSKYFPEIILPEFTSKMETNLDLIAQGKLNRTNYLKSFYLGDQTSILNPTKTALGLKFKAIEVSNERNRLSSMVAATAAASGRLSPTSSPSSSLASAYDYKVLDIKTLAKYGKLLYTGEEELILEKEITIPASPEEKKSSSGLTFSDDSIDNLRTKVQRWKLSIGDDIRKLNEEYLEGIQRSACEGLDYCPSIIPPLHNRNHDRPRGKFIGRWMEKDIYLKDGRFGPYLDHEGFFWYVNFLSFLLCLLSLVSS